MTKTRIFYFALAILLVLGILSLRPIQNLTVEDCLEAKGKVTVLYKEGSRGDIVFKLDDENVKYYINRGEERGLEPKDFHDQYVELKYADHWSLLDPFGRKRHVAEISVNRKVLYTELEVPEYSP